jgi:hypothetical protein
VPRSILARATPLAALAVLLCACGETNIQAIHRLQPLYASHRRAITDVVRRLPPPGDVGAWVAPESMVPPAVFLAGRMDSPRSTAEVLQLEEIEGDGAGQEAHFTLSLSSPLSHSLAWMGPHNPLDPSVHGDRGGLGAECSAAAARPWLVLLRTVEWRTPERLRMEAFVIDRRVDRIIASFPVEVLGRYTRADLGRGPWVAEAERTISSAFFEAASCELSTLLSRLPEASIDLDRRGCNGPFLDIAVPASLGAFKKEAPHAPNQ